MRLRVAGPGLDLVRTLEPGDPAVILGRDADCGICLPDPQRNVSRRHLSLWNEGGELHFHVLSEINGVDVPQGHVAPGARGVLQPGETLRLAEYAVLIERRAAEGSGAEDPWAVFDRDASGIAPVPQDFDSLNTRPASLQRIEEDPFGDWGFETTFGPGGVAGAPLQANALAAAQDMAPFFTGLGLDAKRVGALGTGELEVIGRIVRTLALGLLQVQQAAAEAKQDLNAEDRTMLGVRNAAINPLKGEGAHEDKLRYLFGGRAASVGFLAPERAVGELVGELEAHELASRVAARAAVEGTLAEFDPEVLKAKLLPGGGRLFESARAWDAYAKMYAPRREELAAWAQQLLDRYYAAAYVRESRPGKPGG